MIGKFGRKRSTPKHELNASHRVDWIAKEVPIVSVVLDSGVRLNGPCHYLELELSADEARTLGMQLIQRADEVLLVTRKEVA